MILPIHLKRLTLPLLLSLALAGCGGGSSFGTGNGSGGGDTGDKTGTDNPDTNAPTSIDGKCQLKSNGGADDLTKLTNAEVSAATNMYCYEGVLTPVELSYLEKFKNLERLTLDGTYLGLTGMPSLPKLKYLAIRNVDKITKTAPRLGDGSLNYASSRLVSVSALSNSILPKLETLIIFGHDLNNETLQPIAGLSSLKKLSLSFAKNKSSITDVSVLSSLANLESLTITHTSIKNVDFLKNSAQLVNVVLSDNEIRNIEGIAGVSANIGLEGDAINGDKLDLSHNRIKDVSPLGNINKNARVDVSHNRIEDASSILPWSGELNLKYNCIAGLDSTQSTLKSYCSDDFDPEYMQMGSGSGDDFVKGKLGVSIPTLTDGAKTAITASLVGPTGTLSSKEATVTFSSACINSGKATITGPIKTDTGIATAEYTVKGCEGEDVVTAKTSIEGFDFSATSTIKIVPAAIGSMAFVSSTPSSIGIRGVGLNETSTIKFIIKDKQGKPVRNRKVNFSLNTNVGGITLDPLSALSGDDGSVETTVQAGSVSTTVRVMAEVEEEKAIKTQSSGLVISTGIADQNSFSLSAEVLNPEALNKDGVAVKITAMVADHFNNPVPDGSAVYFTAEGGVIDSECLTKNGACTVEWRSSNPRPSNGRVTILATTLGEESFVDSTGDGFLNDSPDNYTDMAEAFLDKNENGIFDAGEDEVRDFNQNGQWDDKDGEYNGLLCKIDENTENVCSSEKNIYVRDDIVLIMSGPASIIKLSQNGSEVSELDATSGFASAMVAIADRNSQPVPVGSKIEVSMKGGGSILSEGSITVPSTNYNGELMYSVMIEGKELDAGKQAFLSVKVTTPDGIVSSGLWPVKMKVKGQSQVSVAANDDACTGAKNAAGIACDVLANDTGNDALLVESVTSPTTEGGTAMIRDDKKMITYIPKQDFVGEDTFSYTISDGQGGYKTATVKVTITE